MRTQPYTQDLSKFPMHLTGVNPFWNPDSILSKTPRLAAYRRYKSMRAEIEAENAKLGLQERITLNKVFDRMREGEQVSRLSSPKYPPKRYSKVMLYSIVEIFTLVDSPAGARLYAAMEDMRQGLDVQAQLSIRQQDMLVIGALLDQTLSCDAGKLHTREALRDVIAFYTAR